MNLAQNVWLICCLILATQQSVISQINEEAQYLQRVGKLDSLYSDILGETRQFYVQFPRDYDNLGDGIEYPVTFVLDGEVLLPTVHNVQEFYSGGFTPEMILVGIVNTENRIRDLTTSKVTQLYGMPFTAESGHADRFLEFIESELVPFIENKYPVTSFRTLIGHSYGGLFTLYSFLQNPQLFSSYIAIDPSVEWDNQNLLELANGKIALNKYDWKSLFISMNGQLHMADPSVTIDNVMDDSTDFTQFARSIIQFSNIVKQETDENLNYTWKFYPTDLHGTIAFPSIMDGLISNFKWYQMENTDKFNSPLTSVEELKAIINHRATKLRCYFNYPVPPYPEELLNVLGYMSMDMGQSEKSKMFFEFGMQFYPESANTFNSMADYYERNGDFANALKYATEAFEISGSDFHKAKVHRLKDKR